MPLSLAVPQTDASEVRDVLGRDLIIALGELDSDRILGPWSGCLPAEKRPRRAFVPELYDANHAHDHAELCLILAGNCRFSLRGEGALLRAGDLVACPAHVVHAEARRSAGQNYSSVWIGLSPGDPSLHVMRYTRRRGYTMPFGLSLKNVSIEARQALRKLREWVEARHMPAVEVAKEALLTLALVAYRRGLESKGTEVDRREVLVRRAAQWVQERAGEPLTLGQVAQAIGVSPNYLTTLFRDILGVSLGRFIMQERIARAQLMLRENNPGVKQVALELGFPDAYAFSRAFKSQTGLAPSRWVEQQVT